MVSPHYTQWPINVWCFFAALNFSSEPNCWAGKRAERQKNKQHTKINWFEMLMMAKNYYCNNCNYCSDSCLFNGPIASANNLYPKCNSTWDSHSNICYTGKIMFSLEEWLNFSIRIKATNPKCMLYILFITISFKICNSFNIYICFLMDKLFKAIMFRRANKFNCNCCYES